MSEIMKSVSGEDVVSATTTSVVNKIRQYVKDYDGIMLDYDGSSASIFMGWDNFTDVEKDYAMEYDYVVHHHTWHSLSEDNIPVKEVLVDEYGITIFVECK